MYCKIFLIGLCVFVSVNKISSAQVNGSQGQGSKNNESPDYSYDDDDDETKSNEASNIVMVNNNNTRTQLLTKDQKIVTKIGEDVKFDCVVENPHSNTMIIWYIGETAPLYTGPNKITSDARITLDANHTLTIENVNFEDDGMYKCSVLPEKLEAYVTLKILSPVKRISIERDSSENVTNKEIEIDRHLTKKIRLDCITEGGYPEPAYKWSKNGFPIEHIKEKEEIVIENGSLIIGNIKKHHKGEYQCLVENGVGKPLVADVNLNIKFKPAIIRHHDYVNAGEGYSAEIECQYDSNPRATKIIWSLDNNHVIHNGDKYSINNGMTTHHNHTILTIKNINKDDLVTYICKIHNELGEASGKIALGLVPAPAKLESHHYENGVLQTTWSIKSMQPLTELQVLYRPNNNVNSKFLEVKAVITENNKIHEGLWRIKCDVKIPDGEWTITSRAKNTEGWAKTDSSLYQIIQIGEQNKSSNSATNFNVNGVILVLLYTINRLL